MSTRSRLPLDWWVLMAGFAVAVVGAMLGSLLVFMGGPALMVVAIVMAGRSTGKQGHLAPEAEGYVEMAAESWTMAESNIAAGSHQHQTSVTLLPGFHMIQRPSPTMTVFFKADSWRSEPIAPGVRRCPVDVDNDNARRELAGKP